jgi:hypothetical protein
VPEGETNANLLGNMFFFRLPLQIQELLGEDDQSSVEELTARADALPINEARKSGDKINALEGLIVAATGAPPTYSCKRKWTRHSSKKGGRWRQRQLRCLE